MIFLQSFSLRAFVRVAAGISLAVLAACGSPPSRFYTLASGGGSATANRTVSPAVLIDMRPVTVPSALARSQLVIQVNATQVKVLEDDRWASPLPDEIRTAVLATVTRQSGAVDVHGMARTDEVPLYRISVQVQRFETWPGSHVLIEAVWSIQPSNGQETMTCHSIASQPVSLGYDAIADGDRQALQRIATEIARGLRELARRSELHGSPQAVTRPVSCPQMVYAEAGIGVTRSP
ncbi:PqiC family protein [Paraburkholderia madseniana]|uniref:PqiC family protein n=1 Tax=Paraburkholderia madseniana TaxID=2599607 RepID=UPI0012B236B6|nr:PqiC family protein [Paraburkholderia madseniana]